MRLLVLIIPRLSLVCHLRLITIIHFYPLQIIINQILIFCQGFRFWREEAQRQQGECCGTIIATIFGVQRWVRKLRRRHLSVSKEIGLRWIWRSLVLRGCDYSKQKRNTWWKEICGRTFHICYENWKLTRAKRQGKVIGHHEKITGSTKLIIIIVRTQNLQNFVRRHRYT